MCHKSHEKINWETSLLHDSLYLKKKLKNTNLTSLALSFLFWDSEHFMILYPQNPSFYKWDSDLWVSCQFIQLVNLLHVLRHFNHRWCNNNNNNNSYSSISTISLIFLTRFTAGSLDLTGTRIDSWHMPWIKGMGLLWFGVQEGSCATLLICGYVSSQCSHHVRELLSGMLAVTAMRWICKAPSSPQEAICFFPVARSPNLQWWGWWW